MIFFVVVPSGSSRLSFSFALRKAQGNSLRCFSASSAH
jgi:hypothetical protein